MTTEQFKNNSANFGRKKYLYLSTAISSLLLIISGLLFIFQFQLFQNQNGLQNEMGISKVAGIVSFLLIFLSAISILTTRWANKFAEMGSLNLVEPEIENSAQCKLEIILETAKLGLWEWEIESGSMVWDETMFKLFRQKRTSDSETSLPWKSVLHPEDLARFEGEIHNAVMGKKNLDTQFRAQIPNMGPLKMAARGFVQRTPSGQNIRVIGLVWDVTMEEKAKAIAEIESSKFSAVVQGLGRGAILGITDKRGNIIYINQEFCKVSGYNEEELLGKNHRIINSGTHSREFFANMWKTINGGQVWYGEICNRKKDGTIYWVDATIIPLKLINGDLQFMGIRHDITDKKKAMEQLRYTAKFASLGEMASGVAHEINNPLSVIVGKAEKLIRLGEGKPELSGSIDDLRKIEAMATRIAVIVKGLRTFSRQGDNDPFVKTDLGALIAESVSLVSEQFKLSGIDLVVGNFENIEIECRATQISQILINLLKNASDAVASMPKKWIRLECRVLGDSQLEISVTDSGSGIPKEVAKKLMQPFFTTKMVGKGTGLGLSISRSLALNHGGNLRLDENSSNTRFILDLPIRQKISGEVAA